MYQKMLLLLQLIGLSSVVLGQFFDGAGHSPFGSDSGDSETLPISQEELAQLMAQSLASSGGYGRQPYGGHQQSEGNDEFGANFDGEDGAEEAPHQPEEQGHDGQQEQNEGSPYQPQEGHDESHEPQQNSGGYDNSGPNYQQEGEGYQSGQYPDSQSSAHNQGNDDRHQEQQPGAYGGNRNVQYNDNSRGRPSYGQQSEENAGPYGGRQQSPNQQSGYAGPPSGYANYGSDSHRSYDYLRNSPRSHTYRN